ncbi:hypothetical protein SAMN06269117_11816 [Balnearium lithotrophicum]|uniref:DUF6884 domain-containing protein n=1 Tax=Balnearium lithotrophicum TaxID=223788 RepID=A0A521D9Y9_9BACT|nr:DUF6884 domain-containing protein [Balnearium lithotrophicum]SMO67911.1 hypothetical protein SAMN06269117_11816 [Balnearium lithotrophicum]
MRLALVTACGGKKEGTKRKAGLLYKSARIRHLYRKSKELKIPMFIISAKYGLVSADDEIEPYEAVMTDERCRELLPTLLKKLKDFDVVIYFRGGARKEYYNCIREAVDTLKKELVVFGYGNMGDIGKLQGIVEEVRSRG